MACAWATFACYGSMMVMSYVWGQKEYRIPYAWKKLVAYIVIVVLLFGLHTLLLRITDARLYYYTTATLILAAFGFFIFKVERREFQKLPYIGRFVK